MIVAPNGRAALSDGDEVKVGEAHSLWRGVAWVRTTSVIACDSS